MVYEPLSMVTVAAFTDTYLPTVNGVAYTLRQWHEGWRRRGDRMDVVFPKANGYDPDPGEHPVRSLPFPFYDGYRVASPSIPADVNGVELVHAHTPFSLGLAGLRLARKRGAPFIASYHTPSDEYTNYLAPTDRLAAGLGRISKAYERWFLDRADVVVVPSEATKRHLVERLGVEPPVRVIPNGVDLDLFEPADPVSLLDRHGIESDRPLVGYTGRHGYEKKLDELLVAAADMEVTVLLGGDGPAREDLQRQADRVGIDAHFLGFLDRGELPAFYSALDVFAFPSPVETQGLVALEANACGTPVVGCDSGALADTVRDGETGYHYPRGDVEAFRDAIRRALSDRDRLGQACLDRREELSVERSLSILSDLYRRLQNE